MSDKASQAPGEFAADSRIAGSEIPAEIGRGGMAAVFRALDTRLNRWVALKILAPTLAGDDAFRRRLVST
jgi:serine/threonine protein kinase